MDKELLNSLLEHDMYNVCNNMIHPAQSFVGGAQPYSVDLDRDAIIDRDLLVRIDVWMNTMLSFNDFTDKVNQAIYLSESLYGKAFDYLMVDRLIDMGFDIEKHLNGYTYNDPDNCRLTRDIHYSVIKHDGDYYTIFSIHYGADARVGFSDIACFLINDIDYFFLGMSIDAYDEDTDQNYEWYEVEDVAEYREGIGWVNNDTGSVINLYSTANGY